jgi:triphosphoribosyl-dephospho-CoA synthase
MVLLLAPLAKAAENSERTDDLRNSLRSILKALTINDAKLAYDAIRIAQPGGLGKVREADVSAPPSITLLEAMELAQERDAIAREYTTDFKISFETGLPAIHDAISKGADFAGAIVQAFLIILCETPDTLIARKNGLETALEVSRKAKEVLAKGGIFTSQGRASLENMDHMLRDPDHKLNPGTTADLTAATIFLALLSELEVGFSIDAE